ncbi:hypothetical protein A374_02384 [Fictibacillus macauensis ZFHKF-1]|uniref:Pentapeptide repeat-containing protein n=1 Tax=Fictibacillus macauensis ZFHKF-1 TaxID=1196324 RepID=I8AMY2_9BACL|nr:pentapeptide repeat-containing protein [Fictibacillus macauensis]EIT87064.1 hypothetical protein A374_02384 [Fictibacillus macauensis ZFHKF-1]
MCRGKQKEKTIQKLKRIKKIKKGKHVPFSLANSPRKFDGRTNKHLYKTNIHNLIFVDSFFKNIKYTASNITACNFRNSKINGVDFINTNLKKSKFINVYFENVLFYGANIKDTDFSNATFKNVYFINTNTDQAKNLIIDQPGVYILKGSPSLKIDDTLLQSIEKLIEIPKIKKHYVLTTKNSNGKKINYWILYLLLMYFSEKELRNAFQKMYEKNKKTSNKTMFTYFSYLEFLSKYYRKDGIL